MSEAEKIVRSAGISDDGDVAFDALVRGITSALDRARTEATAEALARAGEAAQKAIRGNDVMLAAETGIERAMIAGRNLAAREIIDSIAALKEHQ